eukprot:403354100
MQEHQLKFLSSPEGQKQGQQQFFSLDKHREKPSQKDLNINEMKLSSNPIRMYHHFQKITQNEDVDNQETHRVLLRKSTENLHSNKKLRKLLNKFSILENQSLNCSKLNLHQGLINPSSHRRQISHPTQSSKPAHNHQVRTSYDLLYNLIPDKPHDYEAVLDDVRLKHEKIRRIIDHQINQEKQHLHYRYEKASPVKQMLASTLMKKDVSYLLGVDMEKAKTFKNLANLDQQGQNYFQQNGIENQNMRIQDNYRISNDPNNMSFYQSNLQNKQDTSDEFSKNQLLNQLSKQRTKNKSKRQLSNTYKQDIFIPNQTAIIRNKIKNELNGNQFENHYKNMKSLNSNNNQ